MEDELKPCPICGCEDIKINDAGIKCLNCCLCFYGQADNSTATLIKAWNTRTDKKTVKPKVVLEDGKWENYYCTCGKMVGIVCKYCPECGARFDWSGGEEG